MNFNCVQSGPLAEQAERERQPYLGYLEALLAAELEERERRAIDHRIKDAHLPRVKTLDEFDFRQAPMVSPTRMSELADGGYIERTPDPTDRRRNVITLTPLTTLLTHHSPAFTRHPGD